MFYWSVFVLCLCVVLSCVNCRYVTNYDYDHLVFTQQWPQSVCDCDESGDEQCRIPEKVKTWTIHGIWPTLGKTEGPDYCNRSWPFEEAQILDIETKMEIYWPSLLTTSGNSRISFWEHEWKKHGTCCTDLQILDSEHKYFEKGLELNQKYNLSRMLEDAKIVPNKSRTYQLNDFREAVKKRIGYSPTLHCCKKDSKQRVQEIMICLDKGLHLIKCEGDDEECTDDAPVYYEPLNPF